MIIKNIIYISKLLCKSYKPYYFIMQQIFSDYKTFRQNYQTLRYLTQGAYGQIYLVYDKQSNMLKAEKITKIQKQNNHEQKVIKQAKLLMKLSHANIVKGYGYIIQDRVNKQNQNDINRYVHLIMDFMEGGQLTNYLGKISVKNILEIYYKLKSVLMYLKNESIVHRNITLNNVLVDKNMNIKLGDFKRSSFIEDEDETLKTVFKSGKRYYKAPQIYSSIVSMQSDLWGLGIILLELHIGDIIKNLNQNRIPVDDATFPHAFLQNYKVHPDIKKIVLPLLEKDYQKRCFYGEVLKRSTSDRHIPQNKSYQSFSSKKIDSSVLLKHIKTEKHLTPETTILDLSYCNIGKLGAIQIAQNFFNLVELQLNNNNIGVEGTVQIAKNLRKLVVLHLSYNNICDAGVTQIAKNLLDLEVLFLRSNNIKKEGAIQISKTLLKLKILELSYNNIQNTGIIAIAHNLKKLNELYLWNNLIGDEGILEVADHLVNLVVLDLWNNLIGDIGAIEIAKNLKKLKNLNLSNNNVSDDGAVSIVNHLKNLTTLSLKNNKISQVAKTTILKVITLKQISL